MKKIIGNIIFIIYAIIAVFVTICLLSYNEFKVTEFGETSLVLIDNEELQPNYNKGDLVIVNRDTRIRENDSIFFYNTSADRVEITVANVTNVEKVSNFEYTYTLEGNMIISSEYVIGNTEGVTVIPKLGTVLGILESKWGFLILIVFPSLLAFIYEIQLYLQKLKRVEITKRKTQMNKNKKVLIIIVLLIIIFIILIYAILSTFATFRSEFTGDMKIDNATWKILVNSTDISSNAVKEFVIDDIEIDESQGVEPGKLAPGLKGNFNILIDPTETDVSIMYEIKFDTTDINATNIRIDSVKETMAGNTLIKTDSNTYVGIISLDDIKNNLTNNIQVTLFWCDDGNEDINIGSIPNHKINIPVQVKVSQYLGEEIQEFKAE